MAEINPQRYNALVSQLERTQAELRAVDLSTAAGHRRREELCEEWKHIYKQVKDLEANIIIRITE